MSENIVECGVNFLSFERALKLVPPEFAAAYEWFLSMEGKLIPRLPRGADAPELSVPIKLASQRGMHSPNYAELPSKGAGKKKYVLSAHSAGGVGVGGAVDVGRSASGGGMVTGGTAFSGVATARAGGFYAESVVYEDADMIRHPDGTWTVDYASQTTMAGKKSTDKSNQYMMNNLVDGVPVAFMTRVSGADVFGAGHAGTNAVGMNASGENGAGTRGGYMVHGLAYVEAFNPLTGMFTLHGPVSAEASGTSFCSWIAREDLTEREVELLREADELDGEAFVAAQTMRRRHQDRFRKAVLEAYGERCAATGVTTPNVLQAAHIDSFAKSHSHAVKNGILLRADVHLLYDAHMLTILPGSGRIVVSEAVGEPVYRHLDGMQARFPSDESLRPYAQLLEIHVDSYNSCQRKFGLPCA